MSRSRAVAVLAPVLALVVAVGLVVLAVRASAGDTPRAAAGDVVDPYFSQDDPIGDPVTVRVSWTELTIWSNGPAERLPDDFGQEDGLLPPDGGGFVRVDVDAAVERRLATGTTTLDQPETVLTLVADGERAPLTGVPGGFDLERVASGPQTRYVAVAEGAEGGDLVLEVEYDGVTQRVDLRSGEVDAGADEALAEVPYSRSVGVGVTSCGRPEVSSGYREADLGAPTCEVASSPVLPYVHGRGPAPAGRGYLVVQAPLDELAYLQDTATGDIVYAQVRVLRIEVDGAPVEGPAWLGRPADVLTPATTGSGVALVDAGATSVPVRVVVAAAQSIAGAPGALPVRLTYAFRLDLT